MQQLTQKGVCSSTTLLPIPHPAEIYSGFCLSGYRQTRKLAFILASICLGLVCLFACSEVRFFGLLFWGLWFLFWLGCFWGFGGFFWGEKKLSGCFPLFSCCVSLPSELCQWLWPSNHSQKKCFSRPVSPHPATTCLQGWESNSFSVPVLTGQSSWQDVNAYCDGCS